MKLLYISQLGTNIAAGMNWSVPASVNAQSKIDEVLWVNLSDKYMEHWLKVDAFHKIKEYGGILKLEALPKPFNHPDAVVFEGFYSIKSVRFAKELKKEGIPYIIVPRCSLTQLALHNHAWLKKWIAHKLYFDRYVKNALAIQYLTKQEADDSTGRFHTPYIIIPNGFDSPKETKEKFSSNRFNAVFIGRLEIFQKGLDHLLDAVSSIKSELQNNNFHLDIYGPRRYDHEKIGELIKAKAISSLVTLHDEIGGSEKERVLLDSDLFVMTSRFEGHPMGLVEALAYGIPCFVTPGSNMHDEVHDNDAGWTCGEDVISISNGLLTAIKERSRLAEKSKNALQLSNKYKWSVIAEDFHRSIIELLKK